MKKLVALGILALWLGSTAGCSDQAQESAPTQAPAGQATDAATGTEAQPAMPVVADTDGDGVPDDKDRCPNTPAGTDTDQDGCLADSDLDGVADASDACPDSERGQVVDERGCRPRLQTAREFSVDIEFASGSTSVDETAARDALADAIEVAQMYPETSVHVDAYTDSSGPEALNLRLSQERADAVASAFSAIAGIGADRVAAVGHGEADPVASNATREGRAANRRIVISVRPGES